MKSYEELTITDDFIFCKVMSDAKLCTQMIERLLNIQVDHIEYITRQQEIVPSYLNRGIRLDVYVKDSSRIFDIEMQTTNRRNLEKRTRYYQALIDIDQMEKKMKYNRLKESYIIFICTFDPFRQGRLVYTVRQCFEELPGIKYNDNSHKVFYNLTAKELLDEGSKMGQFLRYLKNHLPTDDYTESIETAVTDAKYNRTWRKEYMTVNMKIWEEKLITQERTTLKNAVIAVKECEANPKLIAEKFDIPLEELLYAVEHGIDSSEDEDQQ